MSLCLSVSVFVPLSHYVSVSLRLSLSLSLSLYVALCLCLCLSLYLFVPVSLFMCLSVFVSVFDPPPPPLCISVSLSVYKIKAMSYKHCTVSLLYWSKSHTRRRGYPAGLPLGQYSSRCWHASLSGFTSSLLPYRCPQHWRELSTSTVFSVPARVKSDTPLSFPSFRGQSSSCWLACVLVL